MEVKKKKRNKEQNRFSTAMIKLKNRLAEDPSHPVFIGTALKEVKEKWISLKEAQNEFEAEIEDKDERSKENNVHDNLNSEREKIVHLAENRLRKYDEKGKFDQAMTDLQSLIDSKSPTAALQSALEKVQETWNALDEAHNEFILEIEEQKQIEENTEHAKLDAQREEIVSFTDELLVRKEALTNSNKNTSGKQGGSNTSLVPQERNSNKNTSGKQGGSNTSLVPQEKNKGSLVNTITNIAKDVHGKIAELLSGVKVSKKGKEKFETMLKDRKVHSWEEDTICKVITGVEMDKYLDFIELFQSTTGISDKVKDSFKIMLMAETQDDQVKSFTCKGVDLKGRYGMFAIVKHDAGCGQKVDIAYSVYSMKSDFVTKTMGENIDFFCSDEGEVKNVERKKGVAKEDLLDMEDINSLSQNFIIHKAMSAFAQSGTIKSIKYEEDSNDEN